MIKNHKINVLILLLSSVFAGSAIAEYCWMIGCRGDEGYIRIPAGQLYRAKSETITINNVIWKIDDQTLLFKQLGIPKVNSVVTVNKRICFASNWSGDWENMDEKPLEKMINYFNMDADDYIYDNNSMTVSLKDYIEYGCLIGKGSKVKILKYITRKVRGGDALFARIKVLSDDND